MAANQKTIYIAPATRELLADIARVYYDGNESAAIAAALASHLGRGDLIRQAVLDLAVSVEVDDRTDVTTDDRAERPHLALAALLDEVAATAIGHALSALWVRWALESEAPDA